MTVRRPPERRVAYPWFKTIATRWADNDMFGHVNNVMYYSYCDTAINRYLIEHCGFTPGSAEALDFTVESGCRFHRSLSYPEDVEVGVRVGRLGTSSVRWEWAIFRSNEDDAAADGFFAHVFVDRVTQRPVPIPASVRRGLERIVEPAG